MDTSDVLRHLRDHLGVASVDDADEAVRQVLSAVSPLIPWPAANRLQSRLPPAWFEALRAEKFDDAAGLPRLLAALEGLDEAQAVERVSTVLSWLAASLDDGGAHALVSGLPADVRGLVRPVEQGSAPPPAHAGGGHRLADGRPGSAHPLSEAKASEAHAESVARTDDPHAETRLSSAKGMTQEREQESLAEGHPKRSNAEDEAP
ncbi:MAG TPA: DUF2267 domain-containing protein [Polyangiaceae bacterium LLY-WYZ-15_(1-7)]|nr:DUF2267 domain-containing protein [Polyangiaceae bacterium LLY-WYZ-15_(1-7)]HJL02947.1 DUF2267 domain-containing protein [Polyangiaceae bacterium LLY-WYZ-15_(1-7)]HJL13665.1 DUF2267 domain-containing protein [Polyangiaceae bacterium LLY-WYZ-15_(1-7)]HJL38720.1 DUF2267 domain-containing protein [Polyangiaceae bacterium LLY-WYZ-15_(1-7)]